MNILVRNITIADPGSPLYRQTADLFIRHGILFFEPGNETYDTEWDGSGCWALPAFTDPFCFIGDPGLEQKETMETAAAAALAGGYGRLMMLPNTKPAIDQRSQVRYVVEQGQRLPVDILPIGAISTGCKGADLAEMHDMRLAGAVAFSDGLHPVPSAQVMLKALQYVKSWDGVVISLPIDDSLTRHGLMHEGIASTRLGMPGMPGMAEGLALHRDLELLRYTGSRLHVTGISTAASVEAIRAAKAEGLHVTCSVTPYHLHFTDEDLHQYDSHLKVNPPLRGHADVAALRQAVTDGTIDCLASHHQPHEWDAKTLEFEYAAYGMATLETTLGALLAACPQLEPGRVAELMGVAAGKIFSLTGSGMVAGEPAMLTVVDPAATFTFEKLHIRSRSSNYGFLGKKLRGKIKAVAAKGSWNTFDI